MKSAGPVRRARGERGQATVEFALVLPLIVMMMLAIVQVAVVARDQLAIVHAAREAVRAASVDPSPDAAARAARHVVADSEVSVVHRGPIGDTVTVEVRRHERTNLPLVGPLFPDPTLHARAVMRVER